MTTSLKKYLLVGLKGIGMGAADVIPGVSGGTIAFMTGIYEELVGSINSINGTAVKLLFKGKFRDFWKHINGNFLISVVAGILISIMSLAKLMTYLLNYEPIPTWAFFFGLIVASSVFMLRDIKGWKGKDFVMLVLGIILGVVVCTLSPTQTPDALWFIFLSGAIAICAMILPGISGSFILLILGKYEFMLSTLTKILSGEGVLLDFAVVLVFIVGISGVSHVVADFISIAIHVCRIEQARDVEHAVVAVVLKCIQSGALGCQVCYISIFYGLIVIAYSERCQKVEPVLSDF